MEGPHRGLGTGQTQRAEEPRALSFEDSGPGATDSEGLCGGTHHCWRWRTVTLKIHENLRCFWQQPPPPMTSCFKLLYILPPPCPHPAPSGGRVRDSGECLGSGSTLFILRDIWGKGRTDLPLRQKAWFNFLLSKKDSLSCALDEIDVSNRLEVVC